MYLSISIYLSNYLSIYQLGVRASDQVKVFVLLSPVGPYYPEGFKPIKLLADTKNIRAWPGGVGNAKVGGNYGASIEPSQKAASKGYAQVLWLFGEDHQITEVGAMNIFFLLKNKDGTTELTTAPLDRGDILPGVTRRSILELAREMPDLTVSERWLTMPELLEASKEGRILEAFGAGTAAVIAPVKAISYNKEEIIIPTGDDAGPIAKRMWNVLADIQYGKVEHDWSWLIKN
jgi:branched-chain amino acid aminotransferase